MPIVVGTHPSWWTEEVRQVLAGHGAALCWADQLGRPATPLWRTAGAPAYLLTGKPRLTPPWLGSSQREVTALPRV
jgi:hypothetical protein